jgi:hypothetical protein
MITLLSSSDCIVYKVRCPLRHRIRTAEREKKIPWKEAEELAPKYAEESFANGPQLQFLKDVRCPPKCHVCLPSKLLIVD